MAVKTGALQISSDLTNIFKVEVKTEQLRKFLTDIATTVNNLNQQVSELTDRIEKLENANNSSIN